MGVEKAKYHQKTLPFQETEERCAKPAQSIKETPKRKDSGREEGEQLVRVSRDEIPNNEAELELKNLLNQVGILTGPLTSQNQILQDCTELKKIIELKGVNKNAKITGLLDHLCAGARWNVESLKDEIKKLQHIRSQSQDRIPEPLKKPLQNQTLYSILDKTKSRKDRPQNEESFGKLFYREMKFENYINPLDNQLHALQWIENFEKKIQFLFTKSSENDSRYVLHKYLSIAKKALMIIKPLAQQAEYSDRKSQAVKD